MGVCIQLTLSKSITQKEWESVYEETLQLVNAFPLVCIQKSVEFRGINVMCLVKTVEKERIYGRNNEIHSMEWTAAGDSVTLRVAENYTLERNLIKEEIPDAGDAILDCFHFICQSRTDMEWIIPFATMCIGNGEKKRRESHIISIWLLLGV